MTAKLRRGRVLVLVGALALAGCGGGGGNTLPACAQRADIAAVTPVSLPEGSRIYGHEVRLGYDVWHAVAPGSLDDVREAFAGRLGDAGYELGEGEVEEHDAETDFEGRDGAGRLELRELEGCAGAVNVELAFRPTR